MHYAVFQVVDTVGGNTVAAIVVAEVASVADIAVEVVQIVATGELIPRMYFVAIAVQMLVATAAVEIADLCLAIVALSIPPINVTQYIYVSMQYNAIHECR